MDETKKARGGTFQEIGLLGQYRFGTGGLGSGIFYEEFLRELHGKRGVEIYKEMSENDDIIGAVLFAIETLMRQVEWTVKEPGNTIADKAAAEFVYSCMHDMDDTWSDFVSEVLSFIVFGWSYHEIVYKRRMGATGSPETRSKHDDGLIGWRKLPIRSQDTLWEWKYDGDTLQGMVQMAPPKYEMTMIPIEKAIHFKTRSRKANPEGRSLLRNAYQDWYFKRRVREIEGIGIERDLAGLPVITPPEGVELYDPDTGSPTDQLLMAEHIVRSIRRDEREGLVLPFGWEFNLVSSGGKRNFDTNQIIQRYDRNIAMTFLADFILLGHEKVGSFALSSDKTQLFNVAMGTYLQMICEVFNNQAIPRLIQLNGDTFKGITAYPELINGEIEAYNLGELGEFLKHTVLSGLITPDENLEDHLRMVADLPERDPATSYGNTDREPQARLTRTGNVVTSPSVTTESEDAADREG